VIVDASLAVKWIFPEQYSDMALNLVSEAVRTREPLVAPPLLPFEVSNAIHRRVRTGIVTAAEGRRLMIQFESYRVLLDTHNLHSESLLIADTFNLPTSYDAYYVALAQTLQFDLWTDDRRLLNNLAGRLPFVRWIGEFSGAL
jgi:predicted nucleic acid-binding protein